LINLREKKLMGMLQEIKEFDKCTVNIPHVHFLKVDYLVRIDGIGWILE
jgi:hypothetical protein